jgi:hypothetical protein
MFIESRCGVDRLIAIEVFRLKMDKQKTGMGCALHCYEGSSAGSVWR